jgi:hypothetical protein
MRIGGALLRTGGIGSVATHGDYRKRGLMTEVGRASIEAMRQLGYDFSILFGIPNYYARFGYTRAWSDSDHNVSLADLPGQKPAQAMRKMDMGDVPRFHGLYNRHFAGVTGTAVRPTYRHLEPRKNSLAFWWGKSWGRCAGYMVVIDNGSRLDVLEAVGKSEQILRGSAQVARELDCDQVRFLGLPYETELSRRLRQGNCTMETRHRRCGGAMVRTINLGQALVKMSGELCSRLRGSLLQGWRGELLIADKTQRMILSMGGGKVKVSVWSHGAGRVAHAVEGGDEIAQLLMGSSEGCEIARTHGMGLRGQAAALVSVLFPNRHPLLAPLDRF